MFMKEVRHSVLATAKVAGVDRNVAQISDPQVSGPNNRIDLGDKLRVLMGLAKEGKPMPKSDDEIQVLIDASYDNDV